MRKNERHSLRADKGRVSYRTTTRNGKKPVLVITGIAAASVAAAAVGWMYSTPEDPIVDVERAQYATREACIDDWNDPADCQQVEDDTAADAALPASTNDSRTEVVETSQSTYIESTSVSVGHYSNWYGPYYTRSGTIYHSYGVQTTGGVPATIHGQTSSLSMRSTSLSSGSRAFSQSPRFVSRAESRAISRGGFTSGHGGESGGHGFGGSRGG